MWQLIQPVLAAVVGVVWAVGLFVLGCGLFVIDCLTFLSLPRIRRTIEANGFALLAYVFASFVVLFVPQMAKAWAVVPSTSPENIVGWGIVLLFVTYVLVLIGFYFTFWMGLTETSGFSSIRLAVIVGAATLVLVCNTSFADYWSAESFGLLGLSDLPWVAQATALFITATLFLSWPFVVSSVVDGPDRRYWPVGTVPPDLREDLDLLKQLQARVPRTVAVINRAMTPMRVVAHGSLKVQYYIDYPLQLLERWMATATVRGLCCCAAIAGALALALLAALAFSERLIDAYPAALGVFGYNLLPPCLLAGWLAARAVWHAWRSPAQVPDPLADVTTRVLLFLTLMAFVGELLWAAASVRFLHLEYIVSYRVYTIWMTFQLGFGLVALGSWVDLAHRQWRCLPVRALALFGVVGVAWLALRTPYPIAPDGQHEGRALLGDDPDRRLKAHNWYRHVLDRLDYIEEHAGAGPVVIVAASGGGSRAALFTSLVLQALAEENFPRLVTPPRTQAAGVISQLGAATQLGPVGAASVAAPWGLWGGKWSDRVLLISSVSGGSLATADFAFGLAANRAPRAPLKNSIPLELKHRLGHEYDAIRANYDNQLLAEQLPPRAAGPLAALRKPFAKLDCPVDPDPDLAWVLHSAFADDMCTDFMAPLLRGVATLDVERGRSVSQFWQHRFHWADPGRPDGGPYDNLSYDPRRPLVVFNATSVRHGSRFLMGFPMLPRRVATMHLSRLADAELSAHGVVDRTAPERRASAIWPNEPPLRGVRHRVRMRPGYSYTLDLRGDPPRSEGNLLDPYLFLLDPTGATVLREDDDSGGDLNAHISDFVPPYSGDYVVLAAAYGTTEGKYRLTVRERPAPASGGTSAFVRPSKYESYDPNAAYTQTLADFCPNHRLGVAEAVRASANFPWGFQTAYLQRDRPRFDPAQRTQARAVLVQWIDHVLPLLPDELNLLDLREKPAEVRAPGREKFPLVFGIQSGDRWDWASYERATRAVQETMTRSADPAPDDRRLDQVLGQLEDLCIDPHAPPPYRAAARMLCRRLAPHTAPPTPEQLRLIDGGVNDNTGITSLVEILLHLEAAANTGDALLDPANQRAAAEILDRLRRRGVIFLEIDSGAKPSAAEMAEPRRPLQALDNATYLEALADRDRNAKRMNELLAPPWDDAYTRVALRDILDVEYQNALSSFAKKKRIADQVEAAKARLRAAPWLLPHRFVCNFATDHDVMTAWSLGPDDKAHVMATFLCELRTWKDFHSAAVLREWCAARDETLNPLARPAPESDKEKAPAVFGRLESFATDYLRAYDRWRVRQQDRIQSQSASRRGD